MKTRDEWKSKRYHLFKLSDKKYLFYKGDARAKSIRRCAVCGRYLVTYQFGKFITTANYFRLDNGIFPTYICKDSHTCFKTYKKLKRRN